MKNLDGLDLMSHKVLRYTIQKPTGVTENNDLKTFVIISCWTHKEDNFKKKTICLDYGNYTAPPFYVG